MGSLRTRVKSKLFINDALERISATFVMALVPTLYTHMQWFSADLADPSKIGIAGAAALGSATKALGGKYIGDKNTAAWLPTRADTPEPVENAPVTGATYDMPPADVDVTMPSVSMPVMTLPEPVVTPKEDTTS